MKSKVSVVITTRNRENDLKHCLGSLACQSLSLDELIVVDNISDDDTALIVENFSKSVSFKVSYINHEQIGYPHVYNRGLKEAKYGWVAFIDDDCIADPDWYKRIKFVTSHFPKISVILGKSNEYYQNNVMALTKSYIDETGKLGAIKNRLILDHEILDSKNIVYNKTFLNENGISFDVNLLKYAQGASEDCDLGMQIGEARGLAVYDVKIKVVHKDPTDFKSYYKKAIFTLRNHLVYEKKWAKLRENMKVSRPLIDKIILFDQFSKKYFLSKFKTILVLINIVITYIFIKVARLFLKLKVDNMSIKQK